MDTKTVKQINQIDAKRQLCLPLTAEEEALFELYGIPRIMQVQPASTRDRLDEVKKKAVFVEYYLSPLLRAADLSITDAKYNFYPETNEEIVTVTYAILTERKRKGTKIVAHRGLRYSLGR